LNDENGELALVETEVAVVWAVVWADPEVDTGMAVVWATPEDTEAPEAILHSSSRRASALTKSAAVQFAARHTLAAVWNAVDVHTQAKSELSHIGGETKRVKRSSQFIRTMMDSQR
jgi:hypothetical protein